MKRTTPQAHKTPNYRLVRHEYRAAPLFPGWPERVYVSHTWEPVPLRATRKDLNVPRL